MDFSEAAVLRAEKNISTQVKYPIADPLGMYIVFKTDTTNVLVIFEQ